MYIKRRIESCIDDAMVSVANNLGVQAKITKSACNKKFPVCELRYFIELRDADKLQAFMEAIKNKFSVCDYEYFLQECDGGILFIYAWNGSFLHWLSNFYLEEAVVTKYSKKYEFAIEISKDSDLEVLKSDWFDGFIEEFEVSSISA